MAAVRPLKRMLFSCGNGEAGQLGHGTFASTPLFTAVLGLCDVDVLSASCGNAHTAAVSTCGAVFAFGSNTRAQLGCEGAAAAVPVPIEVPVPDRCIAVSSGAAFTLALTASGDVWGALAAAAATHHVSVCSPAIG